MKLTVFNGSPKRGKNNTGILINKFVEGFLRTSGNEYEIYKLNGLGSIDEAVNVFKNAECIVLAFPLYVYSMPAGVKEFIEQLEPFCGMCGGKKIGFLVQYGFPEAIHARALEKYLKKLAELLKGEYLGTIIKGGCDGLTRTSVFFNGKTLKGIYEIGRTFGETGIFDNNLLNKYARPEVLSAFSQRFLKYFFMVLNKFYWGAELKKNGVDYEGSFARPYVKELN